MRKLLLILVIPSILLSLVSQKTTGQNIITIGTGTSANSGTTYPAPYGNWYWGAKNQMLITASELNAAGATAGPINSLAFNVQTIAGIALVNFTIKFKNTSSTTAASTFESGMTTVWGPQTYTESSGWNLHTFGSSFTWDGTSNLLIETCFNNTSYVTNASTYYTTTGFTSCVYVRSDASGVCGLTNGTVSTNRPNMQLDFGPTADHDVGVATINTPGSGCTLGASENVQITVRNYGDSTQTSIPVSYRINGGSIISETISTTLTTGSSYDYTFSATADLSAVGSYYFDAWTSLSSDTVTPNDSVAAQLVTNTSPISSFPWLEPFTSFTVGSPGTFVNNWVNETNDNMDWWVNSGSTSSSGTGPTADHTTGSGKYLFLEANGNSLKTALVTSPCLDISSISVPVLDFWYHMYGATMGSLYVDIQSGGVWYLGVDSIIGDQGNAWINKQVNLSTFSGGGVTVRFRGIVGTGTTSDMAIDDISILNVAVAPVAEFAADNIFTCNGIVSYTDLSTNFPATWLWNFGDGNTSTAQHPTHTYTSSGTFTVSLVVSNTYGTDTETKTAYVTVALGGPVTASCAPITSTYCCGMGIFNFTFNTINNTSNDGVDSYQDYSCTNSTTVTEGKTYWLSVETGITYDENVVVWIDFDNDGVFNATDTIFFSNAVINHFDSITIPFGATLGTPLRLRVASDYGPNVVPTPCTAVLYGQFEDYTVVIQPDTFPPVTDFIADATMSCNGVVNFTDLSTSSPTSWFWDFGDGVTSTIQNPGHTYTTDTVYTVTLATCNTFGCDTLVKSGYITVSAGGPIAASCTPVTTAYCCGFGITNVTFGSINNTTNDGVDSYQDYTCQQGTNVTEGNAYALSITTDNPTTHNTLVWIDFDNSGTYDTTEIVLQSLSTLYPAGSVTIPSGAVLNTPLRMRVSSDYDIEAVPTPCGDVTYGQVEDYSVTVLANTSPPVAEFVASDNNSCDGIITFTDNTLNVPTSWLWDFGDGNTSTSQNPTHTYTSDSSFTITLTVTNAFGSDSITKTNYVTVTLGGQPIAPSCTPTTVSYCCGYGIYNVTFGSISNSTNDGVDGYQNYSCDQSATFTEGNSYSISVQTSATNSQDTRVWIDFDNDGTFNTTTELAFSSDNQFSPTGTVTIQAVAGYSIPLRMRVVSDYAGSNPGPCTNLANGQAEDYSIYVIPGNPTITVSPTSVNVGTAMVAATVSNSFAVCNTGTDPLVVSSMVADSSQFTASPNNFVVNPGGCQTVTVNLTPTYIGSISSQLHIYNNDVDTFITVTGSGVGAPIIDTDPDSIIVTITTCGDSAVVPLTVYNTGVSDLMYCVEGSSGGSGNDSVQILALTLDVDMGTEFPNTISAISQYYTKFGLAQINTTVASSLQAALVGKDILLMPEREGGSNAVFSGFASVMQTFVNDGGTVIFCGSSSSYSDGIFNTGLLSGSYMGNASSASINIVNSSYPITDTVSNPFSGTNAFFYYDITNTDAVTLASYTGYDCVTLREVGSNGGKVILIGADFFAYNNDVARLIANSVRWVDPSGSMVSSSTNCDTLVAGDSSIVYITINTSNMNSGTYTSEVVLSSNDPATPYDTIPIIVNYIGQPEIGLSDTCLSFGSVMTGATVSDTVTITNTGCDTLIITSVASSNPDYAGASTSFSILPGDSFNLGILFTPGAMGNSNGTITIYNNDVDTTICVSGIGVGAPVITVVPTSLTANIMGCSDSITIPVSIYNTGLGPLVYNITGGFQAYDSTSLTVYTTSGATTNHTFTGLTNNDSIYITVRLNGDFDSSTEYADLYVDGTSIGQIVDNNVTNGTDIIVTYAFGGSNVTSWLSDGQITVSLVNSSGVNTFVGTEIHEVRLQMNESWLGISPDSATVPIGDTSIVNVTFYSAGLSGGTYYTDITINTNDPANPTIVIPCTLIVSNVPCADFNVTNVSLCTGTATFADNSTNTPTSWAWNFGNGNTSNVQNPTTTFTTGTYTVQLIVCNGTGCDTTSQIVSITSSSGPINASCSPITNSYCCGMGIMNITFNNINNTTGDGVDGYQDYTCVTSTDLFVGQTYTLSVETSTGYLENVKAWIDYNNNGVFEGSEEVLYSASTQQYHSGSVTIPGGTVSNTPLRMRIGDDYYTEAIPDPCTAVTYGQFEDYTVVIVEPPVAAFTSSVLSSCQGTVQFSDISSGNPTSWAWDFGDGNTSSAQNPSYTYLASGPYIAQLTVCNPSGCDVYTFTVTIANIGGPTAACIPATTANCCGMGILNVNLNTINNSSSDGAAGYEDFGCTISTSLIVQQSYTITVQTGLTSNENVKAWIDYNDNGVFEMTELILTSTNQLTNHTVTFAPPVSALLNTELRMRIGSDYYLESAPTSCSDVVYGQYEDYAVTILPNNIPPVANFADSLLDPCQGIVQFTDNSTNTPTSWSWDFGNGSGISSQQNPLYVYTTADTFTVVLIATNAFGSDTIIQQVVASPLSASFTSDVNPVQVGSIITFTNTGSGYTFNWDFGDGYSSNLENPSHVYTATGPYTVTLTVSNAQGCTAQYTMDVLVKLVVIGIEAVDYSEMLSVYPNPTNDKVYINLHGFQGKELSIRMVDVLGKEAWVNDYGIIHDLVLDHDLSIYQKGMYIMYITIGDLQYAKKIILE